MTGLARAGGAGLVVYCATAHWQSKLRRRGSGDIRKSQSPYEKLQTITQKRTNNHKQRKKKKKKKRKTPIKRHYINPSNELFFPINFAFSSCWYPSPISQWPLISSIQDMLLYFTLPVGIEAPLPPQLPPHYIPPFIPRVSPTVVGSALLGSISCSLSPPPPLDKGFRLARLVGGWKGRHPGYGSGGSMVGWGIVAGQ